MRQGRTEASESSLNKAIITEDKWSAALLGTVGHGGPEWRLCWSGECELAAKLGVKPCLSERASGHVQRRRWSVFRELKLRKQLIETCF